jgi:PhnB protein
MAFSAYLQFNGNCREAMSFYAGVFGSTLTLFAAEDAPPGTFGSGLDGRIMHAEFFVNGSGVMASDRPRGSDTGHSGFSVLHAAPDVETARAIFSRLSEGAEITMPFGPTFWSPGYGILRDRFGITWMITVPRDDQETPS